MSSADGRPGIDKLCLISMDVGPNSDSFHSICPGIDQHQPDLDHIRPRVSVADGHAVGVPVVVRVPVSVLAWHSALAWLPAPGMGGRLGRRWQWCRRLCRCRGLRLSRRQCWRRLPLGAHTRCWHELRRRRWRHVGRLGVFCVSVGVVGSGVCPVRLLPEPARCPACSSSPTSSSRTSPPSPLAALWRPPRSAPPPRRRSARRSAARRSRTRRAPSTGRRDFPSRLGPAPAAGAKDAAGATLDVRLWRVLAAPGV